MAVVVPFTWVILFTFWSIASCEEFGLFLENCLGVTSGRVFEEWIRQKAPEKVVLKSVFQCRNVTNAILAVQNSTGMDNGTTYSVFLVTPSMANMLESIFTTSTPRTVKPSVNHLVVDSARTQNFRGTPPGLYQIKAKINKDTMTYQNSSNGLAVLVKLFERLEQDVLTDHQRLGSSKVVIYVYDIENELSQPLSDYAPMAIGITTDNMTESPCQPSGSNSCLELPNVLSKTFYAIGVVERAPYVMFNLDGNGNVINPKGLIVQLMDSLASRLGFSYSLVPQDRHGKLLSNGTWTGAVGALVRNEIDMCAGDFSITRNRSRVADFTAPFMHSTEALVIRRTMLNPTVRDLLRTHLRPFHWSIWITMGVFWITSTSLMALTSDSVTIRPFLKILEGRNVRLDDSPSKERDSWVSILFQLLGILCQQGCNLSPIRTSGRVILFTICLMSLVCYNFYTSVFISFTTVSRKSVPINTLADILRDESFQVGFVQGDMAEDMFTYSEVPAYQKVWARLQRSERTYVKDIEQGMLRAYTEKFAFIADLHALECLKLFAESGLVTRLLAGVMPPMTLDFCEGDNNLEAVGLDRMAGLFLCLTMGFAVAIISLWLERVGLEERDSNKKVTINVKAKSKF